MLLANATQVNDAGAQSALSVLSQVSFTGVNVSNATAFSVTAGLSAVVTATSILATGVNVTALSQVASILSALSDSQFAQLTVPGGAPLTVWSSAIQMSTSLDLVGPDSRLFSQAITAPGSPSSFNAMPADIFADAALNASEGVRTQFFSLSFDPWTLDSSTRASSTRLAFSTPSAPVAVSNLHAPIYFTLPRVTTLQDGLKAQCTFWDTVALNYSSRGCIGVPNPAPPNHTLAFVPGFLVVRDAQMVNAWNMSGPLLANCTMTILDCGADAPGVVYPDPVSPLTVPAVACPARVNGSDTPPPLLRVYTGHHCALWRTNNAYNCTWDNERQARGPAGCRHARARR